MITSKHFSEKEFNRCSPSCSLQDMDQRAMDLMDRARSLAGIPLVITSAYRSPAWDKAKGRSGTGAHTEGTALDFRCNDSSNRWKIILALISAGCKRIGVAKTFVHADFSEKHSKFVIWTY